MKGKNQTCSGHSSVLFFFTFTRSKAVGTPTILQQFSFGKLNLMKLLEDSSLLMYFSELKILWNFVIFLR